MVDLRLLLPALFALACAVVTAAMPFLVPLLRRALGWHITAAQALIIDAAVKRAAGVAAQVIGAAAAGAEPIPVRNAAVAAGVEYVVRRVPAVLAALGLTPDHVDEMVSAELTRLIGGASAAPVPVPVPAPVATASVGTGAARLGAILGLLVLGAGALSACSTAQQATALKAVQQACLVDGQVVPVADATVAAVGATAAASVASVDASVIHPAVVAACASLGGKAVVVSVPAAPVVPKAVGAASTASAAAPAKP